MRARIYARSDTRGDINTIRQLVHHTIISHHCSRISRPGIPSTSLTHSSLTVLLYVHRTEVAYWERGGGGGRGGEEGERVKARRRIPPEKDRRDRRPPPEQWNRHCSVTSALRNCCFSCRGGQGHKDNVRCTAVEEQPEAKEVQLSQPSSTSLLMISSGLS